MSTDVETSAMTETEYTSIRVTTDLADALYDRKGRGESYEDVIWGLLEETED